MDVWFTQSSSRQREVHQYHYQAWSDHGVPAAGSLVSFWRYVTARAMTTAPPLVHCRWLKCNRVVWLLFEYHATE